MANNGAPLWLRGIGLARAPQGLAQLVRSSWLGDQLVPISRGRSAAYFYLLRHDKIQTSGSILLGTVICFFENAQVEVLNVQVKVNPVEAALVACPSSCSLYVTANNRAHINTLKMERKQKKQRLHTKQ